MCDVIYNWFLQKKNKWTKKKKTANRKTWATTGTPSLLLTRCLLIFNLTSLLNPLVTSLQKLSVGLPLMELLLTLSQRLHFVWTPSAPERKKKVLAPMMSSAWWRGGVRGGVRRNAQDALPHYSCNEDKLHLKHFEAHEATSGHSP